MQKKIEKTELNKRRRYKKNLQREHALLNTKFTVPALSLHLHKLAPRAVPSRHPRHLRRRILCCVNILLFAYETIPTACI